MFFELDNSLFLQLPFFLYFLTSLQDIPLDLAILRFGTCYILPLTLWWTFAKNPIYGIAVCALLWIFFTRPTPFSVIRVPYGGLRSKVRRAISHDRIKLIKRKPEEEVDVVNPFATFAFVELISPLINGINQLEFVFRPRKRTNRLIKTSEVNWLFTQINDFGRFLENKTGKQILWSDSRSLPAFIKSLEAPEFIELQDHSLEGLKLFFRDLAIDRNPYKVSAVGRLVLRNFIWGNVVSRESVVKYLKLYPETLDIPISKPLIIIGLPRTGSTFLQALLAQDPDCRHIRMWETGIPVPPPHESTYSTDPRIDLFEKGFKTAKIIDTHFIEELQQFHHVCGDSTEECLMIYHHTVNLFSHYFLCGDGGYKDWYLSQDNKAYAYRYHRRYLQLLSTKYPPRSHWLLKAPMHTLFIEALMKEYPDARVVVTHRYPFGVVTSWSQFQAQMLNIYTYLDNDNTIPITKETIYMLSEMAKRLLNFRKNYHNPDQFLDVRFDDLTKNPIDVVKGIYSHFGLEFTDAFHKKLIEFLKEEPREGKSKATKVKPEDIGVTKELVEEVFREYIDTYLS